MFNLSLPSWEFAVRAAVVYLFLLICFRLFGKRQIGQLAPFDLVLLLIISNAVQNSMNGGDNSLVGGLISAATLLIINFAVAFLIFKSKRFARVVDGEPQILIHNGVVAQEVLDSEFITMDELRESLRMEGCSTIREVKFAILETTGKVSVIRKSEPEPLDEHHATVKWRTLKPKVPST